MLQNTGTRLNISMKFLWLSSNSTQLKPSFLMDLIFVDSRQIVFWLLRLQTLFSLSLGVWKQGIKRLVINQMNEIMEIIFLKSEFRSVASETRVRNVRNPIHTSQSTSPYYILRRLEKSRNISSYWPVARSKHYPSSICSIYRQPCRRYHIY